MTAFLLLSFPLSIICFINAQKNYSAKAFVPAILFGSIPAIILCIILEFFYFSNFIWTENVFRSFLHIFILYSIIPFVCGQALFFIFSRDKLEYKLKAIFPLLSSFFAIYLPYQVLISEDSLSFFTLFFKPILLILFCLSLSFSLQWLRQSVKAKNTAQIIFSLILFFISLIFPSFVEILWYYQIFTFFPCLFMTLLFNAITLVLGIFSGKAPKSE